VQPTDRDVIVVGAGLAGLRCAIRLTELGHRVTVLEAATHVGGRIRTDEIDGFRCDHGFQVFNPGYPAVKRWVDVEALAVQHFGSGVLIRREHRLVVLADPVRSPGMVTGSLRSGVLKARELAALLRWIGPTLASPRRTMYDADETLGASLDRSGVNGALRREVLQPFLAGVSADSHEATSARLSKLLVRMFALGRPGLPQDGMRALPEQLAAALRARGGSVLLEERVEDLTRGDDSVTVRTSSQHYLADAVVVAADPLAACALAGLPEPAMKGLVTWWFGADEAPHPLPLLAVDGRRLPGRSPGPVWNAAVISNAAPSYAPAGRHLICATTVLDSPDGEAPESAIRHHLGEIYGCDTADWDLVARHHIPRALPAFAPLTPFRSAVDLGDGLFVCGDHRDTPSIQGALVSGHRTAESVNARLSVR
jgi:phytoene dehydrogenase-like protein